MVGRPPELSLRNEQESDLGGYDLVTFTQKGERKEGEADPIKLTQKGELTLTLAMTNRLSVQQTEALKAEGKAFLLRCTTHAGIYEVCHPKHSPDIAQNKKDLQRCVASP